MGGRIVYAGLPQHRQRGPAAVLVVDSEEGDVGVGHRSFLEDGQLALAREAPRREEVDDDRRDRAASAASFTVRRILITVDTFTRLPPER